MSDTILLHNGSNLISEENKLFQKPPTGRSISSRSRRVTASDGEDKLAKDRNGACNGKCDNIVDDSGFQSNLSGESLEHCEMSLDNEDPDMKFMETGMNGRENHPSSAAPSPRPSRPPSRQMTSTPTSQVKRRSSFTISCPSGPSLPISRAPSLRMTASVTQDYSTTGRNHASQYLPGSLVAHTVAERRARAEALDAERRRKRQAKLEASEAALQAACQRAQSLRAARSAELRSKEEEKRARVTERRKLLEKNRAEILNRRISRMTNSQFQERPSRQASSRVSICGFSSDLDPSDPRYCPFGFGSSSRRDVCLSTKQQLIASKPPQTINNLSTSMATNSLSRLNKTSFGTTFSTHSVGGDRSTNSNTPLSLNEKNKGTTNSKANSVCKASNQNTLNRCNINKVVRLSTYSTASCNNIKQSTEVAKTSPPSKATQPITDKESNNGRSCIPPRPGLRGRPPSVRSIKNTAPRPNLSPSIIDQKSVERKIDTSNTTTRCPPLSVSAGCEPSEVNAQIYRARIKEQRRIARERQRHEEEETARRQVNVDLDRIDSTAKLAEEIRYDSELKAEAVEASKTISENETVACKAAHLLSSISTGNEVNGAPLGDNKDVLESALSTSKKVLSNAVENMTLSANTGCTLKSQSEIINVLSNAVSNSSGWEKRCARLDEIMNRVRTSSGASSVSNGLDNSIAPLTITVSCVNGVEGEDMKRYQLKPCEAIKSMLESGRLPENCKAAVLLRNRIARYEHVSPSKLLAIKFMGRQNALELDQSLFVINPNAQVVDKFPNSPEDSGNEQDSREDTDWNTSSTSTTVAVCFPLNRRIQPDELLPSQNSSCSDISTNSGLQN
ncbi:unnamed protein product [Hymenolepis diminuta]|uniref:Microtubule-associated protein n=1 Tax=Hymenolepis diminuta TaxID=6216 RepID=A0A158QFG8_HYMDI|nr:unnamed protein product [Hymenolepis diminuta]